ncbi:MAG TPA: nuclear transport factor 2 family protein [Thermoanaerobaculia bacterium]|nr:nuclear transport factor 2 family protein [Thermoanaerobaculia bacterium]
MKGGTAVEAHQEVLDTINDLFVGTDDRDWDRVRAALAPRVLFDMKSLTGAEPATISAEEIIAGWEEGLRPLKAVHHQTGNFRIRVDDDGADAFCYGIALHYRPNASGRNTRTFVGSYDFHLQRTGGRWRIDLFRFNMKYVDGNLELEKGS